MIAKYGFAALAALFGVLALILTFSIYGLHLPLIGTIFRGYADVVDDLTAERNKLASDLRDCNVRLTAQTESLALTGVEVLIANDWAKNAEEACKQTQRALERGRVNAEKIRNEPDNGDAGAAYVRSLCERPEARNHPACAR